MSLLEKLKKGLSRTREGIWNKTAALFSRKIDEDFYEELEELLIQGDVGVKTTMEITEELREIQREKKLEGDELFSAFKELLVEKLPRSEYAPQKGEQNMVLMVGVNGTGKTTSLAKLARYYHNEGMSPLLVAADTFRAAAIDQLKVWGQRLDLPVIAQNPGADPAAVAYDAREAGRARKNDMLLVDTAGRLHTQKNLMEELKKVKRVLTRDGDPVTTFLVLDATSGQNALEQGKEFNTALEIDGVILTKLDGTAKGGIVFALAQELGLPVYMVGLGEGMDDLKEFDPEIFVDQLLGE